MKIYVASSWKNTLQPIVVNTLAGLGHEVYDFKKPPGKTGFNWKQVDETYKPGEKISADRYLKILASPISKAGYEADLKALNECDVCVAVLPFGKSASWELGYAKGLAKRVIVLQATIEEPELM